MYVNKKLTTVIYNIYVPMFYFAYNSQATTQKSPLFFVRYCVDKVFL